MSDLNEAHSKWGQTCEQRKEQRLPFLIKRSNNEPVPCLPSLSYLCWLAPPGGWGFETWCPPPREAPKWLGSSPRRGAADSPESCAREARLFVLSGRSSFDFTHAAILFRQRAPASAQRIQLALSRLFVHCPRGCGDNSASANSAEAVGALSSDFYPNAGSCFGFMCRSGRSFLLRQRQTAGFHESLHSKRPRVFRDSSVAMGAKRDGDTRISSSKKGKYSSFQVIRLSFCHATTRISDYLDI